jgi:hypothetical protein
MTYTTPSSVRLFSFWTEGVESLIVPVNDTMRDLFYRGRLMLVPEPTVVDALSQFYRNPDRARQYIVDVSAAGNAGKIISWAACQLYNTADGDQTRFKYYLIPSCELDQMTLRRASFNQSNASSGTQDIPYPFIELGPVESHIFPHFVIYHAACQWLDHLHDFRTNAIRILGPNLGLDKKDILSYMFWIVTLRIIWVRDTDEYTGFPARDWFFGGSLERYERSEDGSCVTNEYSTTGGDMSVPAGSEVEDDEDDVRQTPVLTDAVEDNWYLRIQEWARASSAYHSSQKVSRSTRHPRFTALTRFRLFLHMRRNVARKTRYSKRMHAKHLHLGSSTSHGGVLLYPGPVKPHTSITFGDRQ